MTTSAAAPSDVEKATSGAGRCPRTTGHGWLSQHVGTAIVGGSWAISWATGSVTTSAVPTLHREQWAELTRRPLGAVFMVAGWLLGIGALNYPLLKIVGREAKPEVEHVGWSKYFRYNLDHKVVGIQYVVGVSCSSSRVGFWQWPSVTSS